LLVGRRAESWRVDSPGEVFAARTLCVSEAVVTVNCVPELIAQEQHDDCPPFATWAVAAVAVTAGIVAALSATRYGYYYDELYFIAAGRRLSFSYIDQGPFVPLLARSMD
jgi:hypothetical protein